MTIAAGICVCHPRSISRCAIAARRPTPISTTSVTSFGATVSIADANASVSCPPTTRNADETPRWVTGIPASAGAATALGDARHDLEADAGGAQCQRFFAAATEHERIAALQPHYALAATRRTNHQPLIVCCDIAWRRARLPTKNLWAWRASLSTRRSISASYSTRSAARSRATARRVSSPGSPGPAPTSETWPGLTLSPPRAPRSPRLQSEDDFSQRARCARSLTL